MVVLEWNKKWPNKAIWCECWFDLGKTQCWYWIARHFGEMLELLWDNSMLEWYDFDFRTSWWEYWVDITLSGNGHVIPPINSVGPSRLGEAYLVARSRVPLDNTFRRFLLGWFNLQTGSLVATDSGRGSLYFPQLSVTRPNHLLLM